MEIVLYVLDGRRGDEPEKIVDAGGVVVLLAAAGSSSMIGWGHHHVGKFLLAGNACLVLALFICPPIVHCLRPGSCRRSSEGKAKKLNKADVVENFSLSRTGQKLK